MVFQDHLRKNVSGILEERLRFFSIMHQRYLDFNVARMKKKQRFQGGPKAFDRKF